MRKGTKIVLFIGLGILAAGLITVITIFAVNRFSFRKIIENSTAGSKQVEVEEKLQEVDMEIVN